MHSCNHMHAPHGTWLYVENDPGVRTSSILDPASGLDERTRAELEYVSKALENGRTLNESLLQEAGKKIGSAQLSANVLTRDTDTRQRYQALGQSGATMQRSALRVASNNSSRQVSKITEDTGRRLRGLFNRWINGRITLGEMRTKSAAELRRAYEGMRDAGRRAAGMDKLGASTTVLREEETWFRDAVREELRYWNSFLDDVDEGRDSPRKANMRLNNYVKALRFMFEAARVQALPDTTLLYWMGPKKSDPTICAGCAQMMEWSPFTKSTIPAVPRDGSTPCLTNCRHRVVVRVAQSFNEVVRRNSQLDKLRIRTRTRAESSQPRARMVKKLEEIKQDAHGGRKRGRTVRGKGGNPFSGERLPAVPRQQTLRQRMRAALGEGVGDAPDEQGRENIGVFIPVPAKYREGFPSKDEDSSDPHVTALYIGDCNPSEYLLVVECIRRMIREHNITPFTIEMTDYGEFTTPNGKVIAHMIPRSQGDPSLPRLHELLYQYVTKAGINCEHHRDGAYKPHVTLSYMDSPGYDGPRPTGIWRCGGLELWGAGLFGGEGRLGRTFIPFQPGAPATMTEATIRTTPLSNFDQSPYSSMDLREVARMLKRAAERRDMNTLLPLLERVIAALETVTVAVEGRSRGHQVARMFREAFADLVNALDDLPESITEHTYRLDQLLMRLES